MATHQSKIHDKKYNNWVKAGLALHYTKEGIEPFVCRVMQQFQITCLDGICYDHGLMSGTSCSGCLTQNLVACQTKGMCRMIQGKCSFHSDSSMQFKSSGCPKQLCDNFKRKIKKSHRFNDPSFKNTSAHIWCSNYWEVAKCFMPPDGYKNITSAADTDFNGIISVIINLKDFQQKVNDDLSRDNNIFQRARDIGKEIRHTPDLQVSESNLQQYFTDLHSILSDPGYLATDTDAKNAKEKLKMLQNDTLIIGQEDVRKIFHDAAEAAQEKIRIASVKQKEVSINEISNALSNALTELKEAASKTERENYIISRREMKNDLIALYRRQYHTLPLSPLFEENDTPLLDFYVMPELKIIENQRSLGGGFKKTYMVTSLREVFHRKGKRYLESYLIADAGLGKTAFCKRLALTWCQAHNRIEQDNKYFEKNEIDAMSEFELVFLLSLRECSEECIIDDIINKQIIPYLANKSEITENVLSKEKCLVILDGLDEWSHPASNCIYGHSDIPHRRARDCTILTTSRPWKLSAINLKSSQIDQKLELSGLSKGLRDKLKMNVMLIMTNSEDEEAEQNTNKFNLAVIEKGISDLETIPLLLLYLLCIWCDEVELGRSKCEIYCQIVELLLKRTFKKFPRMNITAGNQKIETPNCFAEMEHCKSHFDFLLILGDLAFKTLFSDIKEKKIVFDSSVAQQYLKDFLTLSRLSGIITQDKESKLTKQILKTSFSHKTVQEYFAALYISTCSDHEQVKTRVLNVCNSIADILEMSKVFIFISGINAKLFSYLSKDLMDIVNKDAITKAYRSMTWPPDYDKYDKPLKEIQSMFISCNKENMDTQDVKMCLHDFFLDIDCQQKSYYKNLRLLVEQNKQDLQSINIKIEEINNISKIMTDFKLSDPMIHCQKIFYRGEYKEPEIVSLLSRNVECVTIASSSWQNKHFADHNSCWSLKMSHTFENNEKLHATNISNFRMTHDVMEGLLNFFRKRKAMKEIVLFNLSCSDHGDKCPGFSLDLSQHSDLITLGFDHVPLSKLSINSTSLEDCIVGPLCRPGMASSYLSALKEARSLHTFMCSDLATSSETQIMLQTLSLLKKVKDVTLFNLNLGESELPHEMVNIECVWLRKVVLSSTSLRLFIRDVQKLSQSVTVIMENCEITPDREFDEIKDSIYKSKNCVVMFDGERRKDMYRFEFRTKS